MAKPAFLSPLPTRYICRVLCQGQPHRWAPEGGRGCRGFVHQLQQRKLCPALTKSVPKNDSHLSLPCPALQTCCAAPSARPPTCPGLGGWRWRSERHAACSCCTPPRRPSCTGAAGQAGHAGTGGGPHGEADWHGRGCLQLQGTGGVCMCVALTDCPASPFCHLQRPQVAQPACGRALDGEGFG